MNFEKENKPYRINVVCEQLKAGKAGSLVVCIVL